jgi:hypothetical protein
MTMSANNLPRASARIHPSNHRRFFVLMAILLTVTAFTLRASLLLAFNGGDSPYKTTTTTTTKPTPTTGSARRDADVVIPSAAIITNSVSRSKEIEFVTNNTSTNTSAAGIIYISKFCNASIGEFVMTDYSADVIVDISKFMVFHKDPVLVRRSRSISNANGAFQKQQKQKPYATCVLGGYRFFDHFPHFMQQLYRCWSFWQQNLDKQHVFILSPKVQSTNRWRRAMSKEFNRGMLRLLPQVGVLVIDSPEDILLDEQTEKNNNITTATTATTNDTESISAFAAGRAILNPDETHFQTAATKDMNTLRDQMLSVILGTTNTNSTSSTSTSGCQAQPPRGSNSSSNIISPRIAIIDRKSNRKIPNIAEVVADLQLHFPLNYEIPVIYLERTSFEDQVKILSGIDILITPHGAQETGVVFMPDCGSVLEMFPDHYYYPRFFGSLAASAGLKHSFLNLALNTSLHDQVGKGGDVCPHTSTLRRALEAMLAQWHKCCHERPQ